MSEIPQSRVEAILQSKIDGTSYDKPPLSRVEALLLDLDTGGGGGGTTDYSQLTNKPSIGGTTLEGELDPTDIGAEPDKDYYYDSTDESLTLR